MSAAARRRRIDEIVHEGADEGAEEGVGNASTPSPRAIEGLLGAGGADRHGDGHGDKHGDRFGDRLGGWRVVADGLEHAGTGYFIARDALAARRADGLWDWPLHLAEKAWCAPGAFRAAFLEALRAFGIRADAGLALSFLAASGAAVPAPSDARPAGGHPDGRPLGALVAPVVDALGGGLAPRGRSLALVR